MYVRQMLVRRKYAISKIGRICETVSRRVPERYLKRTEKDKTRGQFSLEPDLCQKSRAVFVVRSYELGAHFIRSARWWNGKSRMAAVLPFSEVSLRTTY